MIKCEVIGSEKIQARLSNMPYAIRSRLAQAIRESGIFLANYIKRNKLSGQVLNVRTDNLRSSVISEFSQSSTEIQALVGPGPLKYARIHEFGGTFTKTSKLGKSFSVTYPKRSYLRTSLDEAREQIRSKMMEAISNGVHKS